MSSCSTARMGFPIMMSLRRRQSCRSGAAWRGDSDNSRCGSHAYSQVQDRGHLPHVHGAMPMWQEFGKAQLRESRVYREAPDASYVEKGSQVHRHALTACAGRYCSDKMSVLRGWHLFCLLCCRYRSRDGRGRYEQLTFKIIEL